MGPPIKKNNLELTRLFWRINLLPEKKLDWPFFFNKRVNSPGLWPETYTSSTRVGHNSHAFNYQNWRVQALKQRASVIINTHKQKRQAAPSIASEQQFSTFDVSLTLHRTWFCQKARHQVKALCKQVYFCLNWVALFFACHKSMEENLLSSVRTTVFKESEALDGKCIKIEGYDFNQGVNYSKLLKSMVSTGFQASNLGDAIQVVNNMVSKLISFL